MSGANDHPQPYVSLIVNGTRLPSSVLSWFELLTLKQTCDGADILTVSMNAWDEVRACYRNLAEKGIFPGAQVVLEAGYGTPGFGSSNPLPKGRYELQFRKPQYTLDGVKVVFEGYDGLRRMTDNKQSRVWLDATQDSAIVEDLAMNEYGWAVDVVPTPPMPPPNAALTAPSRGSSKSKKAIAPTGFRKGDRIKPLGLSDLAFVKVMSETFGYMYPKIRWDATLGREVFVFRPPNTDANDWSQTLRYRPPNCGQSDIATFTPEFSLTDAPTGVEFLAWDRKAGKPIRVIATITTKGPDVRCEDAQRMDERIAKEIKSGAALRLSVLGAGTKAATLRRTSLKTKHGTKSWNPQVEVRESMAGTLVPMPRDATPEALMAQARQWLLDRQAAWWTMSATFHNLIGSHMFDSDQVHKVVGVDTMDEGWYIFLSATHTWNPKERSHDVEVSGQKLIDGDALGVKTRTEEL